MAANLANQKLMTEEFIPALDKATAPAPPASFANEADFRDPYWQETLFSCNYAKLIDIKKRYDPYNLFYAAISVGSEVWTPQLDGRLCRT